MGTSSHLAQTSHGWSQMKPQTTVRSDFGGTTDRRNQKRRLRRVTTQPKAHRRKRKALNPSGPSLPWPNRKVCIYPPDPLVEGLLPPRGSCSIAGHPFPGHFVRGVADGRQGAIAPLSDGQTERNRPPLVNNIKWLHGSLFAGVRMQVGALLLRKHGFTNVHNLGPMTAW